MDMLVDTAISAILSGGVIATVLSLVLHRKTKSIEQHLRVQAETRLNALRSTREWREAVLSRVLGPCLMHFARTRRAFDRWKDQQLILEEVIRRSNQYMRDLLLDQGHLIPADLIEPASALVEHFDAWLEEFEKKRGSENPDLDTKYIFTGPQGYGFPREAEQAFIKKFHEIREDLYGTA